MSTSHYSSTNYEPKPNSIKSVVSDWSEPLSHPSLAHSRPESTDSGSGTLYAYNRMDIPPNTRRRRPLLTAYTFLFLGICLSVLDGIALTRFANEPFEAAVISMSAMAAGAFVLAAGIMIGARR